jgi:hypothetical protein
MIRDFTHVKKIGIFRNNDLPVGTQALEPPCKHFPPLAAC